MNKIFPWPSIILKSRLLNNLSTPCSIHCTPVSRYNLQDLHTLGLGENATKEDIKAAYFTKAKQLHPDSSTR